MAGSRELLQLRAELSRYREQKSRGKYPSELRERAEAYARERTRVGATPTEIATELGVHKMTAYCRPVSLMLQPLASSMLRDGEELYAARMAIMEGARSAYATREDDVHGSADLAFRLSAMNSHQKSDRRVAAPLPATAPKFPPIVAPTLASRRGRSTAGAEQRRGAGHKIGDEET